jgi:hypothetical protein
MSEYGGLDVPGRIHSIGGLRLYSRSLKNDFSIFPRAYDLIICTTVLLA